ncbi:MAG: inositol monophosphatase [Bacteroidia bacterium]|nr:inositol monophosphatase [Bacteroidia bacterium]
MDLKTLCSKVCDLSRETGKFILNEKSKISADIIENKGMHDFVTYVDKTSEKKIIEGLKTYFPEAGFLAEENTVKQTNSEYTWVIDPLDGTTNYIHGLDPYAISIALMQKDEILLGVVYVVSNDECFYAWKDSKAYLNGKEISVSKRKTVSDSLIAIGFPYYDYERITAFLKSVDYFCHKSHGVRRLGSAATDLAYVACGRFETFYEYSLHPWDVAAGAIIVRQAGGKVCDFKGGDDFIFGKEIIATNNYVYNEFVDLVKNFMN